MEVTDLETKHVVLECSEVAQEMSKILEGITSCVERGEGKGKCHVFLDQSDVCQCGDVDLAKERMR